MKKWFVFLTVLFLMLGSAAALADVPQLTAAELSDYCASFLQEALEQAPVSTEQTEEGLYCFGYDGFLLYSPDAQLTAESPVTAIDLTLGSELMADMRGIGPSNTLEAVLEAYPLDNADLHGTPDEAVLYISGRLPDTVNTGFVIRNGSHVVQVEHDVYTWDGEAVQLDYVSYALDKNAVVGVRIELGAQRLSQEEAQVDLDRQAALQEETAYRMYREKNPAPLAREDLSFGPIDFVSAVPEDLERALGAVESDTWEADGEGFLRIMQWEGVQAVWQYDAQKQHGTLSLLQIHGEQLEGPRGLHVGDSLDSALGRFPHETSYDVLYGDGETPPYGVLNLFHGGAYAVYAVSADTETVLLELNFVNDELWVITCAYL